MPAFPKNFRHVADQIYAGSAPDSNFLYFFKNTLGGKTVLSLDANVSANIDQIVKSLGLKHITIPLNASDPNITDNLKNAIRSVNQNVLTNNEPIYIHCLHGSDRTGFVTALYRVMKQNWNCDQAISEARKYQYGHGISLPTQKLWRTILCAKGNVDSAKADDLAKTDDIMELDDDIVQIMRDDFEMGNVPPAFTMQQSFAPEIDLRNERDVNDIRSRKRKLRRKLLQDINDNSIPMVGDRSGYGCPGGFGPIENSGIMQFL